MDTDTLVERVIDSTAGALDIITIALGHQLGLYDALRDHGPLTPVALADLTDTSARYAREWLEQQCVAGFLDVDDPGADPDTRRFTLPDDHAAVFANPDTTAYLAPLATLIAAAGAQFPALVDAYRTGGGIPWADYGHVMRQSQADLNRPWFLRELGSTWLPAVPGLTTSLSAGGRVADIGCGEGWSAIGIALTYPDTTVDGFDLDPASIDAARRHATEHDVADRVRFHLGDAAGADTGEGYDLVLALECVHDLADPVSVLAAMRVLVRAGGHVMVMDERAPEHFTGPGDAVEQLLYGWSTTICLPDSLSHRPSVGTGTVMRPSTLRGYAVAAGFTDIDILPIENDLWRFYELVV